IRDLYLDLTTMPDMEHVDLVVWPEAALPVAMLEDGETMASIAAVLSGGPALAAGVYRFEADGQELRNSLAVLDFPGGAPRLVGLYDKVKLVPFGEFT